MLIGKDGKLVKERLKWWNDINSGKLIIINKQHNILALKELQLLGCANKLGFELSRWEVYCLELGPCKAWKHLQILLLHQPFGACTTNVGMVDYQQVEYLACTQLSSSERWKARALDK